MAAFGLDLITATTSVAACLHNIGPDLARVGSTATYAGVSAGGKAFLTLYMMLSRLEPGAILMLFVPDCWRR